MLNAHQQEVDKSGKRGHHGEVNSMGKPSPGSLLCSLSGRESIELDIRRKNVHLNELLSLLCSIKATIQADFHWQTTIICRKLSNSGADF